MPRLIIKPVLKLDTAYFEIKIPELVRPYETPPGTTGYAITVDGIGYSTPTDLLTEVDKSYSVGVLSEFYHPEYNDIWHSGWLIRRFHHEIWETVLDVENWARPMSLFVRTFSHTFTYPDEVLEIRVRFNSVKKPIYLCILSTYTYPLP